MDLKTSERGGPIIDYWRGAVRLAGFMPGFGVGMKRDRRVSLLRPLGNFRSLECSGAFGLTVRVREKWGRGKAVRPKSKVERWLWKFAEGAIPGGARVWQVSRRSLEGELEA